ncbi:uncharacterized protein A1O9_12872, partial [Exophiala aquamarina CBS 119918]
GLPNKMSDFESLFQGVRELNQRLDEWARLAPSPFRPTDVIRTDIKLEKVSVYNILYLRYAYYGTVACLNSSLIQPYANMNLEGEHNRLYRDQIQQSWELAVEASRAMIKYTKYANVDCGCPV